MNTESCRCNNCMTVYEHDEDLEIMEDEGGYFKGCPKCETDGFLMDFEESQND